MQQQYSLHYQINIANWLSIVDVDPPQAADSDAEEPVKSLPRKRLKAVHGGTLPSDKFGPAVPSEDEEEEEEEEIPLAGPSTGRRGKLQRPGSRGGDPALPDDSGKPPAKLRTYRTKGRGRK